MFHWLCCSRGSAKPGINFESFFLAVRVGDINEKLIEKLAKARNAIILLHATPNIFHSFAMQFFTMERGIANPIALSLNIDTKNVDEFKLMASAIAGPTVH